MKIGFVQTSAIGDILIGIPAAKWYVDRGFDVFWPIDSLFIDFFSRAAPYINFLPVSNSLNGFDYWLGAPNLLLKDNNVKDIFTLYIYLGTNEGRLDFGQSLHLSESLKFDEYKYAIAEVPFSEKWNLVIERDNISENIILEKISAHIPYTIVHEAPAGVRRSIPENIPSDETTRIIKPEHLTASPLDWLAAFENASVIACEDSIFANLVEQRNLMNLKYLFLRSLIRNTPIFKNGWIFK
jgi:hypothetical protein